VDAAPWDHLAVRVTVRGAFRRLLRRGPRGRESYSQCGEDLIVRFIFDQLDLARPTYLDIGAHHPFDLSNTAALHKHGSRGVNVEPELVHHRILAKYRRRDTNILAGAAPEQGTMRFYVLSSPTLSTFLERQVELYRAQFDVDVVREIDVPVITPTEILDQHRTPDFLSLDTEGMDALILESIDFARHPIKVICVETTEMSRTS
jgi:FkbM family methyltransferase